MPPSSLDPDLATLPSGALSGASSHSRALSGPSLSPPESEGVYPAGFQGPFKYYHSIPVSTSDLRRPQILLGTTDSSLSPKTQAGHPQNTSVSCTSQLTLCLACGRPGKSLQRHSRKPLAHQGSFRMPGLKTNYPYHHTTPHPPKTSAF